MLLAGEIMEFTETTKIYAHLSPEKNSEDMEKVKV